MMDVEGVVAAFLDERERTPGVDPEEFLARLSRPPAGALAAIRRALELEELLRTPPAAGPRALPSGLAGARIVRELGAGGVGRVLEIERGGERFALKLLHAAALADARARRRFRREAEVLGRLEHPGIVRVVATGLDEAPPWLLLEKVDGVALSDLDLPIAPRRAAEIVRDLADAAEVAHRAGLLHRDIKPSNVMLPDVGGPVLLDFGMASAADASTLTESGDRLGTPSYMAPEQVRGRPVDARTDVHALGLILFELITGHPARTGGSRGEVMSAAARGGLRAPTGLVPAVPADLESIVLTAAARHPAHRYDSAATLSEDLTRFLGGRGVLARPPGPVRRGLVRAREHPLLVSFGVAVVAVSLIVGFGLGRGSAPSREAIERAFDRGLAAWAEGHEKRAAACHDELRRLAPGDPRTRRLGDLLAGKADAASADRMTALLLNARRELERRRPAAAFALAKEAAELVPGSAQAAALVARSATTPEALEWAARWMSSLARERPESAAVASAHGKLLRRRRQLEEAEAELRRGLALDAGSAPLHHELALVLDDLGRQDEAAAAAREAARLTRGESRAVLNNLAAFLDKLGESGEAETIYRDLCRRFPSRYQSWFNLGYLLDRQSRVGEARPLYEKCLELEPRMLDATLCLAWLLATAPDPAGDVDRAAQLLSEARRRHADRQPPALTRLIHDVEQRTGRKIPD